MKMKRISAPAIWHIPRKTKRRFIYSPMPGPHAKEKCLPLGHILRDILMICSNDKEVRQLLNSRVVSVDGVARTSPRFAVGLMDTLSIRDLQWRVLPAKKGFMLQPITEDESKIKLLKILNKTNVKGKIQLNFHDGRNMIVDKDIYRTSDVVVLDLTSGTVKSVLTFKRGMLALVIDGVNRGIIGKIEEIVTIKGGQPNRVILKTENGDIETLADYVIVVGQDRPIIEIAKGV